MKTIFFITITGIVIILSIVILFSLYGDTNDSNTEYLDIANIDGKYVQLNPTGKCASISLERISQDKLEEIQSQNRQFFEITDTDIKEMPVLGELILATHKIDFPTNDYSSTDVGLKEFVDYEFFIMDKAIAKYGDTQNNYFLKIDSDLDKRLADPKKQGFSNEFVSPLIIYDDKIYTLGGTVFWVSDEDEYQTLSIRLADKIQNDAKLVTLTDDDMKSIPKIKQLIETIGTKQESIVAFKGVNENPDWKNYREWFKQKKSEFDTNGTMISGFVYEGEHYDLGFPIC